MHKNELDRTELSALLDGEIKDLPAVEELGRRLKDDRALAAEFEEQREIKAMLASLADYEAPDFLATRVAGEIAERSRRRRPLALMRNLGLVATGFLLGLALIMTLTYINGNRPQPELARDLMLSDATPVPPEGLHVQNWEGWQSVPQIAGVEDERVKDFLALAMKAHSYRVLATKSEAASPDMADAILVLDQGGGR